MEGIYTSKPAVKKNFLVNEKKASFFLQSLVYYSSRGVAQLGRALPWGGRGRGFKSRRSDHSCTQRAVT